MRSHAIEFARRRAARAGAVSLAAALSVAAAPGSALAQEQAAEPSTDIPTAAVMDFTSFVLGGAADAQVNLGKAITAMLVTEFSARDGMQVIERAELNDILREQDLALSGRVDEASAIEVGKLLGAQYVMHGQVTSIDENLRMDIRAVDVETSEVVSVLKKSDRTTELLATVQQLADEFGAQLDLVPPSERPDVEPIPVAATIEFSRAIDYEDRGQIEDAIRHYESALEIHPSHRGARRALERLRGESR